MNEWIKTTDRLPKDGEDVICTCEIFDNDKYVDMFTYYTKNGVMKDDYDIEEDGFYGYGSEYDYILFDNVIAWMECPKAYEEG